MKPAPNKGFAAMLADEYVFIFLLGISICFGRRNSIDLLWIFSSSVFQLASLAS